MRCLTIAISFALTATSASAGGLIFDEFVQTKGISSEVYKNILGSADKIIVDSGGPTLTGPASPTPLPPPKQEVPQDPFVAAKRALESAVKPRIIGGTRAHIEDLPWQVMLVIGDAPDPVRQGFCGGSLIRAQWVITAAHCMASISEPGEVDIISGSTYPKFTTTGDRVKVEKVIVNPKWNPENYENDFAILKLVNPVRLGTPVPIIASGVDIPPGTRATVSGRGALYVGDTMSDILMRAEVPTVSTDECSQHALYKDKIKDSMICAGFREGGLDACQGDSGGPLVATINGTSTLIGVVSWGIGCAEREKYGVYGRLATASDWVKSVAFPAQLATSQ